LEGPLYEEKGRLRRAVRRRVRFCAARAERLRIQRRDRMFASGNRFRFRTPRRRKRCCKLVVDGKVVSDPEVLIGEWVEHFRELAKSRRDGTSGLEELQQKVDGLALESLGNEDMLLDVPFSAEEVAAAVGRLKRGKAAGPDGLMAEHLKAGGQGMVIWLLNVLNAVVELEAVPDILKRGVVVPVYKGGGKDPLRVNSYRGVTLSSIVAKVLEFLCLDRLQMVFLEADLPHVNQTAYRKSVSCADAIFATQEVIARYLNSGSKVYMCLYDLQKAFDSVEYAVLMDKLFEVGVNGKMWRLLRNWYDGGSCRVKVDGRLSETYPVGRGVKQGSVLSPALFLLVLDPLCRLPGWGSPSTTSMLGGFFTQMMSGLWQQARNPWKHRWPW